MYTGVQGTECTVYSECTEYSVQSTVFRVQSKGTDTEYSTVQRVECTEYRVQCTVFRVQGTEYSLQCKCTE